MTEFSLIDDYFKTLSPQRDDVAVGIGDDAAVVNIPHGQQLVVSTDTLNRGIHFPENTAPEDIGYKTLAVNLSDMAAMGATPAWVTLAISLPEENPGWLAAFSEGFAELTKKYNVQLIGGDTTRGPLSLTVTVMGLLPAGSARLRSSAQAGDRIGVSGTIGDAALGLLIATGKLPSADKNHFYYLQRLNRPTPRVELGQRLRPLVSSMIDVSDGLLADLSHILQASQVGGSINVEDVPLSDAVRACMPHQGGIGWVLSAGDDYELCFTFSARNENRIREICDQLDLSFSVIGVITQEPGLQVYENQQRLELSKTGFDHFNE